jgi:hypothetical protein
VPYAAYGFRSYKDISLAEHAENAEKKGASNGFLRALAPLREDCLWSHSRSVRKPMSLAKPRSRKGGQEWVSSASRRLREKMGFWSFEATKTHLSQGTRRTQSKQSPLIGFLGAFAALRENCLWSHSRSVRKPMSLAKPRSRKGEQKRVFSAPPRENGFLVFRSHKDPSLAGHAENAERKNCNRFSSRLRGFARELPLVVFPIRKKTHVSRKAAKPQRRAGMGFLRVSASPRENGFWCLEATRPLLSQGTRRTQCSKGPSSGFLRAFAPLRENCLWPYSRSGTIPMPLAKLRSRKGGQNRVVRNRPGLISTAQLLTCVSNR